MYVDIAISNCFPNFVVFSCYAKFLISTNRLSRNRRRVVFKGITGQIIARHVTFLCFYWTRAQISSFSLPCPVFYGTNIDGKPFSVHLPTLHALVSVFLGMPLYFLCVACILGRVIRDWLRLKEGSFSSLEKKIWFFFRRRNRRLLPFKNYRLPVQNFFFFLAK